MRLGVGLGVEECGNGWKWVWKSVDGCGRGGSGCRWVGVVVGVYGCEQRWTRMQDGCVLGVNVKVWVWLGGIWVCTRKSLF